MVYSKCSRILDFTVGYVENYTTRYIHVIIDSGKLFVSISSGEISITPEYYNGTTSYNLGMKTVSINGATWDFSSYIKDNAEQQIDFSKSAYPWYIPLQPSTILPGSVNAGDTTKYNIAHGVTMKPYKGGGANAFTWTEGPDKFTNYTLNKLNPTAEIIVKGTLNNVEWVCGKINLSRSGSSVTISGTFSGTENGKTYHIDSGGLDVYISGNKISSPVTSSNPSISARSFSVGDSDVVIRFAKYNENPYNLVFDVTYTSTTWGGHVSQATESVLLTKRNKNSVSSFTIPAPFLSPTPDGKFECGNSYLLMHSYGSASNATKTVCDVQVMIDNSSWADVTKSTSNTSTSYLIPSPCNTLQFRARATATNENAPTDGSVIRSYTTDWKESPIYAPEGGISSYGYVNINGTWYSLM